MTVAAWIIAGSATALSYLLVGVLRRIAISHDLLDLPNERSSHTIATPRGGGMAIVVAFLYATIALWAVDLLSIEILGALILAGVAIAGIGFLDDRFRLRASIRLVIHLGTAIAFVIVAGGYPTADLHKWGVSGLLAGSAFSVVALVWGTNLFNFMDGIDGIAAGESIFIAVCGGWLNILVGGDFGSTAVLLSLAGASLGFLAWNWPPAQIFMGDVGSGFLGFMVAASFMATRSLPIEVLPILGGVFFVDATVTLIRRILRRDRWMDPHRTHAYQHLARRLGQHRSVTMIVLTVNVVWLLPWATATTYYPGNGQLFMAAALLPLVIIAIALGAGRPEQNAVKH